MLDERGAITLNFERAKSLTLQAVARHIRPKSPLWSPSRGRQASQIIRILSIQLFRLARV